MWINITTAVSLFIALAAIVLATYQNVLQRRAVESQLLLHLMDEMRNQSIAAGLSRLAALRQYDDYSIFEAEESAETQAQIYAAIDFLNNMAHLVAEKLLPRQKVWNLHFTAYRIGYQKLVPWWLNGQRKQGYPQRFSYFERMGKQVMRVSDDAMMRYAAKEARKSL